MSDEIITLHPSTMEIFYKCPARWDYGNKYKIEIQAFKDGSDAHAIVAGKPTADASDRAKAYAKTFMSVIQTWDFKIMRQEFPVKWDIAPGIRLSGIIDAIATMHGVPILIDWKTASNIEYWNLEVTDAENESGFTKINAKASAFQGRAYLMEPDASVLKELGLTEWPMTIYFVIGSHRGDVKVIPYSFSEEDTDDFIQGARLMAAAIRNNIFPKVRGEACGIGTPIVCPFLDVCYKRKGWEGKYQEKKKNGK